MIPWHERAHEERNLFNPAFCSILFWYAARGASENPNPTRSSLCYTESFLILPLILHEGTRRSLPIRINSSLPVWVTRNPLAIASLPRRARALIPYTKEALFFGTAGQLFKFEGEQLQANADQESDIRAMLRRSSDEVQLCARKTRFLGKWLTRTGTPETIFTLLGVRP